MVSVGYTWIDSCFFYNCQSFYDGGAISSITNSHYSLTIPILNFVSAHVVVQSTPINLSCWSGVRSILVPRFWWCHSR